MKHSILLIAAIAMSCFTAKAQHFNITPSQHMVDSVETKKYSGQRIDMSPVDTAALQLEWKLLSNTLDPDWSVSVCDYGGCYAYVPANGVMNLITAQDLANGVTPFMQLLVTTREEEARGTVVIYFNDINNDSIGDTISFTVQSVAPIVDTTEASGIHDFSNDDDIRIFPNPASRLVTVAAQSIDQVQLFDMTGAIIQVETSYNENGLEIDVSELKAGAYMLQASGETAIYRTKLLKQ